MKLTTIVATAALAMLGSTAFAADQSFTGTVTVLDRINNELAIKPAPAGQTTGANAPTQVQKFKMPGAIPESVHAEDKVTVSYSEANGVKTITNLAPQKD
jgi:hypothetical protein